MKLFLRTIIILFSVVCLVTSFVPTNKLFTAAEQQQISIATPNLFKNDNRFEIDFRNTANIPYAFPLPVGKGKVLDNNILEIDAKKGNQVKAMFDGVVRLSRKHNSYGNVIVVRHAYGFETMYANNAQNMVRVGEQVQAGKTIAIVGKKNNRTYCAVAFLVNGNRINPSIFIDIPSKALKKQLLSCKKIGNKVHVSVIKPVENTINASTKMPYAAIEDPFASSNTFEINLQDLQKEGNWAYPLPRAKLISAYGGKRRHGGIDLKTKPKDKIVAAFAGVVTASGTQSGYGNRIVIKHKWGFETLYSHQYKNMVKVGQKVKAGDVIGLTGRTGRATTEHLHFEMKYKGRKLNPEMFFDTNKRQLQNAVITITKTGGIKSKRLGKSN